MEAIEQWMEGEERDYAAGVALLAQAGGSQVLLALLHHGESGFTRGKLEQALQALVDNPHQATPTRAAAPVPAAGGPTSPPEPTRAVDPQRRDWFAERNHLHAQLGLVATDEQRRVMALRILALGQLISGSYDAERGRVPAPVAAPAVQGPDLATLDDVGEIRRLLANLKSQRSKLKKRPNRASDLARAEADILTLETKLKP